MGLAEESEAANVRAEELRAEWFVAWHGLATAYYLLRRGRTEEEALGEVDRILSWARVATAGDAAARQARGMGFTDFEDALQAASAEACSATWIVTRDVTGFKNSRVAAISPLEFLQRFPLV